MDDSNAATNLQHVSAVVISARSRRRKPAKKAKPTHYKVICISMYTRDLDELDAKVRELKKRGRTKANKSDLIRIALAQLDLDRVAVLQ